MSLTVCILNLLAVLFGFVASEVAALLVINLVRQDVWTTLLVKLVGASSWATVQGSLAAKPKTFFSIHALLYKIKVNPDSAIKTHVLGSQEGADATGCCCCLTG